MKVSHSCSPTFLNTASGPTGSVSEMQKAPPVQLDLQNYEFIRRFWDRKEPKLIGITHGLWLKSNLKPSESFTYDLHRLTWCQCTSQSLFYSNRFSTPFLILTSCDINLLCGSSICCVDQPQYTSWHLSLAEGCFWGASTSQVSCSYSYSSNSNNWIIKNIWGNFFLPRVFVSFMSPKLVYFKCLYNCITPTL